MTSSACCHGTVAPAVSIFAEQAHLVEGHMLAAVPSSGVIPSVVPGSVHLATAVRTQCEKSAASAAPTNVCCAYNTCRFAVHRMC
jgi:hypothetical protein